MFRLRLPMLSYSRIPTTIRSSPRPSLAVPMSSRRAWHTRSPCSVLLGAGLCLDLRHSHPDRCRPDGRIPIGQGFRRCRAGIVSCREKSVEYLDREKPGVRLYRAWKRKEPAGHSGSEAPGRARSPMAGWPSGLDSPGRNRTARRPRRSRHGDHAMTGRMSFRRPASPARRPAVSPERLPVTPRRRSRSKAQRCSTRSTRSRTTNSPHRTSSSTRAFVHRNRLSRWSRPCV